ncbi:MAG: magnesium/cobalt transporter CorA [Deltaproteobacteria bacterium]|nr:MAG: magnesium/cobalt transporter CorA [Deltaproteobacteria bacterium]
MSGAKRTAPRKRAARSQRLVRASAQLPREALRFLGVAHRWRRRTPPVGARPGELVVRRDAPATQLHWMVYGTGSVEEGDTRDPAEVAARLGDPQRVVWVDIHGFGDPAVLEQVGQHFDIHPLALADVVNVPQRPKAELYGDRLLIIMQMARCSETGEIEVEQVSLILGPGWVVTVQEHPGDVFDPVRTRIRAGSGRIRQMGADFLVYALLDAVIDGYFPVLETIGGVIDRLEEEVMELPTRATLARIHATRRTLQHIHRLQWRQRDAVAAIMRDEAYPFSVEVRPYLRDAHDHAFQILDAIESFRDMSVGLMDVYLSSASHRMNEVMKTLTVVASIFIPLTFLAGVYGMNFDHMPELHWRWGYAALWGVMIGVAVGLVTWFRRRGWIERRETQGAAKDDPQPR